jgi:hypothetical protein
MTSRFTALSPLVLAAFIGCSSATGGITPEFDPPGSEPTGDPPADPGTDPGADPGADDAGTGPVDTATGPADTGKKDTGTSTPDTTTPPTDTGSAATDTGSPATDTAPPPSEPPVTGLPLAANLGIAEVAVFQGVKVSVARAGSKVTARPADVVAGREALVRVYVAPKAGFSGTVRGELKLESASGTRIYTATLTPTAASSDATLASTLNFSVPTGVIAVDTRYAVTLYAASGGTSGDTSGARYPAAGTPESIDARSTGETLKIKIVPIQYNADGSGRLPDVSAAQIERYRQAFYAMYPAKQVEVTVRAPYAWPSTIAPNGSGFSAALNAMVKLRAADGAPKDVYYYGAFMATSTFSTYCSGGCVTGLCGLLTYPNDATGRACVGVGYPGTDSPQTAAHEIGHAHGRAHAPCGTSSYDTAYPWSGGSIGAWGYDLIAKKLYSPSTTKDFMSYCSPTWISDYTYKQIATRMAFVNGAPDVVVPFDAPRTYRFVEVGEGGKLTWGDTLELQEPPIAEPHTVRYLDEAGRLLDTATGAYYPYGDLPGGYMLVPEAPASASTVNISGTATLGLEARLARFAR